jgi:hypothetical protein
MSALRIFSRFAELLDIKTNRAAAAWLRLNADGTYSERTAAETRGDIGAQVAGNYIQNNSGARIPPRITTITSSATPTINTDECDMVTITALAAAITSMTTNLTGMPNNGEMLLFRIKDNGTARAITWGASFVAMGTALPTTTVISKTLHALFIWDSVASKWACLSTAQES